MGAYKKLQLSALSEALKFKSRLPALCAGASAEKATETVHQVGS